MASLLGDYVIILSRRILLTTVQENDPDLPFWSFIGTWNRATPFLGTFHASDFVQTFLWCSAKFCQTSDVRILFLVRLSSRLEARKRPPNLATVERRKTAHEFHGEQGGVIKGQLQAEAVQILAGEPREVPTVTRRP